MDRRLIDQPLFSFSELLELTKLGRGTIEGYLKRGIVSPSPAESRGSGHHRKYTGRDVLKFAAVGFLTKAGLSPQDIAWIAADDIPVKVDPKTEKPLQLGPGPLRRVIDDFIALGPSDKFRRQSGLIFNNVLFARLQDLSGREMPGLVTLPKFSDLAEMQRKWNAVTYTVFDAPLFVWYGFELLENYLTQRGAHET